VYRSLGRPEDTVATYTSGIAKARRHLELNPEDVRALYLCGGALVETGHVEEGLELVSKAVTISPSETGLLYNVACIYSNVGRLDEALDYLEKAVDAGYNHKAWMETDSDLDRLRSSDRYKALVKKIDART
jgi:tetratricopeptide (TPR) repeat protein